MSDDKSQTVRVLTVTQWTPTLFSFQVTRPESFKFTAGQFVRLGVNPHNLAHFTPKKALESLPTLQLETTIFRAYSVASSPYDEFLEFFSVVIPDGAFTATLQYLQAGDTLWLNPMPYGFLTLARYQLPLPQDLWLLATGTGLAPFLSILKTLEVWQQYQQIILVYSARTQAELAYQDDITSLKDFYGQGETSADFRFIPMVTREPEFDGLQQRLPVLIANGELETFANRRFNPATSHVMVCGNPQMVEDTKVALKQKGLTMNRRGEGNIAVENYW